MPDTKSMLSLRRRFVLGALCSLFVAISPALTALQQGQTKSLQLQATQQQFKHSQQRLIQVEQHLFARATQAGEQVYLPLTSLARWARF